MIMKCFQSKLQIRMQSMQSLANGTPSPELRRIQKYFSLSLRIRIKPQHEEIMDFQWFEHVTWDSIKDLRGTTYVQPPTVQVCVRTSSRCHATYNHSQQPSLTGIRVSLGSACSQQLAPSGDDLQSMRLRATVHTFWMQCDIAPVQSATRRTATQQKQSRVRKVAASARTGEKGRALAAARNAPRVPATEQIVQQIKSLYPTDPELPAPAQAFVSSIFLSEVAEHISNHTSQQCHDSVTQDHSECARNIGMTLALWRRTVTCLCK